VRVPVASIREPCRRTSSISSLVLRPLYRIDLLNAIDGVSFAEVWAGATGTTVEGQKIRVIGLDELRKNKTATGRRKDAEDVRKLGALSARKNR